MVTISKLDELVGEALVNAIRLHLDSVILCKSGSFSSANQLAMDASRELAKTIVLEQLLTKMLNSQNGANDSTFKRSLAETFTSQRMLKRHFTKSIRELSKQLECADLTELLKKIAEQINDEDRIKMIYVGLTKKDGKIDLDGKKVLPRLIGRKEKAQRHITLNNDFLSVYMNGYINGVYSISSDTMAWEMNQHNFDILQMEWPYAGRKAVKALQVFSKVAKKDEAAQGNAVEIFPLKDTYYNEEKAFI